MVTDLPEKRDPFELNYYLRPHVTTGAERTAMGKLHHTGQKFKDVKPELYHKLNNPRSDTDGLTGANIQPVTSEDYGPGDTMFI